MLCENCGEREATVHFTKIINGKKEEIHLCEQCAKKTEKLNLNDNNLDFQSLLSGILNTNFGSDKSSILNKNNTQTSNQRCPNCGLTYKEFIDNGYFGCSECFKAFEENLAPLFKRIHGNLRHNGKRPALFAEKLESQNKIDKLKGKMQSAVEKENFEKAAELRDKIHAIKENMEENKNGK